MVAQCKGNQERTLNTVGSVLESEAIFIVTIETAKKPTIFRALFPDSSNHVSYQSV